MKLYLRLTIVVLILCLVSAGWTSNAAAIQTHRYVATTGSDTGNDCLNEITPCETVDHAISVALSGDVIDIAAGTYPTTSVSVNKSLDFVGEGMNDTILDGGGYRVVTVWSGYSVSFTGLTMQNGEYALGTGGGIENYGSLTLTQVKVTGNTAQSGAGIFTSGDLTMIDCEVSNNQAIPGGIAASGGGVYLYYNSGPQTANLTNVTISGNTAIDSSGGLHIQGLGTVNLTNVTISGNSANTGGGLGNTGTITLNITNSTIANNHLTGSSPLRGGINNYATVNTTNTIVAGNDGDQCNSSDGTWNSNGHNLSSDSTCNFTATNDQQDKNPLLGALMDNGGYTKTHALLPGSPAIDAGNTTTCAASPVNNLDQRGQPRPVDGDYDLTADCDIGALEFQAISGSDTLRSQKRYDGWILEKTETSGKGGTKNNTSKTFFVGDDAYNRQYRSILSFNTSGIPDSAIITSVKLKIKKAGLVGTNPLKTHGGLYTDIRKGKFGTSTKLQLSDFKAKASKNKVGKFKKASSGWYRATLGSGAYPYVKLNGTTQFRLRFAKDDNNDFGADYLKFYSGNAGTSSRPQLIVEYIIP